MDFWDVIRKRRSVRNYSYTEIPEEHLKKILEAGRLAPSGANKQPWHFIVVEDRKTTKQILEFKSQSMNWAEEASALIIGLTDPEKASISDHLNIKKNLCEVDLSIALSFMDLAAVSLGYGTCWVMCYENEGIKNLLEVPSGVKLMAMLVIGKDAKPGPREAWKRDLKKISSHEKYGKNLKD